MIRFSRHWLTPKTWLRSCRRCAMGVVGFARFIPDVLRFNVLLITFLFAQLIQKIASFRFFPKILTRIFGPALQKIYDFICSHSRHKDQTINRLNLIQLAIKNMMTRRSRAIITMGGMAVGIGAIVFLVSLGYGVQRLVINRVARLEELSQADIATQPGSQIALTDDELYRIKEFEETEVILPMISVVGRVTYNNSISDMAVYGVTADYLAHSAIRTVRGKVFESNEVSVAPGFQVGTVAGAMTIANLPQEVVYNGYIRDVMLNITPGTWIRVREEPDPESTLLGYTRRTQGDVVATEVSGQEYALPTDPNTTDNRWIVKEFPLWDLVPCTIEEDPTCEDEQYIPQRSNGTQVIQEGYVAEIGLIATDAYYDPSAVQSPEGSGEVLGETIDLTELLAQEQSATDAATLELFQIASASGFLTDQSQTVKLELADSAVQEAVVNQAMLQVLGIAVDDAVGQTFTAQFVITSDLLDNVEEKRESVPAEYTIVGVIPGTDTPFFYVPFIDLRGLGVSNYSQAKLVVTGKQLLDDVRTKVEAMGFSTTSVADTVDQIDQLFATARVLLAVLGIVALSVAALGMFNTLTVSLLERTREVGLMKAMGMRSHEVRDLFLTESMIMGFFGGVFGITIGFVGGKLLGLALTVFAFSNNGGYLDVSFIPLTFLIVVFTLSVTVGILTGLYPAYRATKISALDALRYE